MEGLGRHRPLALGHEDVRGQPLFALQTPQHALDSGQELARIEWLANIVIGTGLKSHDTIDRIGSGGDHNDAESAAAFAQPACQREPILAGEANVEQDDSRQFTLDEPAPRRPAIHAGHTEIVFAEVLDPQMALGGLVFDHDDVRPVVCHCLLAPISTRAKHCRPCRVRQVPANSPPGLRYRRYTLPASATLARYALSLKSDR